MLKKTKTWVLILGCVLLAPVFASGADVPAKGPSAFLPASIHEFAPVLEGTPVTDVSCGWRMPAGKKGAMSTP